MSLELEAGLVGQLAGMVARAERQLLATAYSAATMAARATCAPAAYPASSAPAPDPSRPLALQAWQPGYAAGVVYGGVICSTSSRSLPQEGAVLAGVGAAVAGLPAVLRQVLSLAD